MQDLVSVVVPVYNAQKYLQSCVDSIINQTYRNLEIILVDDGSTDQSGMICDEYADKDERIRVVHKENGGAADARNAGLQCVKGEYIVFIDSDDFVHARFIELLLAIAKKKEADIVVGDYVLFHEGDSREDKVFYESDIDKAEVLTQKHLYNNDFIKRETVRFVVPWGKICKSKLFEGICYPVGKINEDTWVSYKIIEKANKVVYFKEPIYYWHENMQSVTHGKFSIKYLSGLDAFKEQLEYYQSVGKMRHVEIVYDEYRDWFFWCYNEMKAAGMDYKKELKPYYIYMKKYIRYIKMTRSIGIKAWIKYRYLVYYRIPKLLK